MTGLRASDLVYAWQVALGQAALPLRFVAVSSQALLTSSESFVHASGADRPSASDPFGAIGPSVFDPNSIGRPDPRDDVATWLRRVVARASTLCERLEADWLVAEPPKTPHVVDVWLRRWATLVAPADDVREALDRFLLWEGLDAKSVARAAGSVRMREGAQVPAWAETLREALFEADFEDSFGICDSKRPLPFETLHLPFVSLFLSRLQAEVPDIDSLLTPQAQTGLARDLLRTLVQMACEPLYVEFSRYRNSGFAPLMPFISDEPDALYRRFVAAMQCGGLRAFYASYPVLARMQAVFTELAVETAIEFLCRLKADLPEIRCRWRAPDLGPVTETTGSLGDRHRGGRRVVAITFAGGLRLVYKPKDLGIDVAFNDFLAWYNKQGAPVALRPLLVLDRDGYGWTEFAAPEACPDTPAIERYYHRVGALICLVYVLQGTDCHAENLIASGEHPVLIDCETLLNLRPRATLAHGDRWLALTQQLMRGSVLSSGLIPGADADAADFGNVPCGICDGRRAGREGRARWVDINTDRMATYTIFDWPWTMNNLPHVAGIPTHAEDYLDSIAAGFEATYRFLTEQRPALLDPAGPLTAFRGRFVRFVFRATRVYGSVLLLAFRPSRLRDGADFSLAFELLARALLTVKERPASWPILQVERQALAQGDIPFLGAYTDQDGLELGDGGRVSGYFVQPSYDVLLEKVRNLGEVDLAFQMGLLRNAIQEGALRDGLRPAR